MTYGDHDCPDCSKKEIENDINVQCRLCEEKFIAGNGYCGYCADCYKYLITTFFLEENPITGKELEERMNKNK